MALATALPIAVGSHRRRLAQTDDPALIVLRPDVDMNDDLADIADPGQLVKLHVRVQHAAGLLVHDALFHQRGCRFP